MSTQDTLPTTPTDEPSILIDEDSFAAIDSLCDAGLFHQAHSQALRAGPLERWRGARARLVAARIWIHLCAAGRHRRAIVATFRDEPDDPLAQVEYARLLSDERSALEAWRFLRARPIAAGASPFARHERATLEARIASDLRDFNAVTAHLARAESLFPSWPWAPAYRAAAYLWENRLADALAAIDDALAREPSNRFAIDYKATILRHLDRREDAIELLSGAVARMESPTLAWTLATLEVETDRLDAAERSLDRFAALATLIEEPGRQALSGFRAHVAHRRGDRARALAEARRAGKGGARFAERLAREDLGDRRVQLEVPFIPQDRMTCVPATLATIARFFGGEVEHLEIAPEICYDGTPNHRARRWADVAGWRTRELRVTWPSARALLDRGVPFILFTRYATSGHAQALIGYDERNGTLLVRDPSRPGILEREIEALLERDQSAGGPRGLVLVPAARASLVDDLELPASARLDRLYELMLALDEHDRERAARLRDALVAEDPDCFVSLSARQALASYDDDVTESLRVAERVLALHPDDARARLTRSRLRVALASRAERVAELEAMVRREDADPVLFERLAAELHADARERERAERLLLRSMRARRESASALALLANIRWDERDFDESTELYRLASCQEETDERSASSYFRAVRSVRRAPEGIRFLERRFERLGDLSGAPAATLQTALDEVGKVADGLAALDAGLARRPDDGSLLLAGAHALADVGRIAEARARLARAAGRAPRPALLRAAAHLDAHDAPAERRLGLWREIAEAEPLDVGAHGALAHLLAATRGQPAALSHLAAVARRWPHSRPIGRLYLEWLEGGDPTVRLGAIDAFLADHPADDWAHRERALALVEGGKFAEARASLARAAEIAPRDVLTLLTRAHVEETAGDRAAAEKALRDSFAESADCKRAIEKLFDHTSGDAERRSLVEALLDGVRERSVNGDGLLTLYPLARAALTADEMLETLRRIRDARPELWATWSCEVRQLHIMNRLDEAAALAREAERCFPLVSALCSDAAYVARAQGDAVAEIAAFERAHAMAPFDQAPVCRLADALERAGDHGRARALLERACTRAPRNAKLVLELARHLHRRGERPAAIAAVERAITLDPDDADAWELFSSWSEGDRARRAVESSAGARPWSAAAQLMLSSVLDSLGEVDGALAAADRAVAADPRHVDAHDQRALLLGKKKHFDLAIAACAPPALGAHVPPWLRGRAAWIESQRGDLDAAIRKMEAVLADRPGYVWGWRRLTEWHHEQDGRRSAAEAFARVARLEPWNAETQAHLGWRLARAGRVAEARAAYDRAIALGLDHAGSQCQRIDLLIAAGDLEGAERSLPALARLDRESARTRALRIRLRRGDEAGALDLLREVATDAAATEWHVGYARRACIQAGLGEKAQALLTTVGRAGELNALAAELWIRTVCIRESNAAIIALLRALPASSPAARKGIETHLFRLRQRGDNGPARATVRALRRWLRSDDQTWSWALNTYVMLDAVIASALWMRGWRTRAGLTPWALDKISWVYRTLGRHAGAREALQRAVAVGPANEVTPRHRLFLAYEEAGFGDTAAARAQMKALEGVELPEGLPPLRSIVLAMLDVQEAPVAKRGAALQQAKERLASVVPRRMRPGHRPTGRLVERAARRIARDAGTAGAMWWAYWPWVVRLGAVPAAVGAGWLLMLILLSFAQHPRASDDAWRVLGPLLSLIIWSSIRASKKK